LLFAYGLGIPLAAIFCFAFKMGLAGMWFGIAVANGALVVAIHRMQKNVDWTKIA
jgi:Na+-driven multidrug efflux pump